MMGGWTERTGSKFTAASAQPLSSARSKNIATHETLRGTGLVWGVGEASRAGDGNGARVSEDERMFSTPKYIRNPQRNRLQAQHLTYCSQGFRSSAFSVEVFPYPEAILEWFSAKKRCGIF